MPKHLYTLPSGVSLPSTSGLPEGSPFLLVNGDGTVALKALHAGEWKDTAPAAPTPPPAPSVPDAPTGVTAVAGDATADVSWTAPASDGGFAVTSYVVTPNNGTSDLTPTTVAGTVLDTTITGLTNGTAYTFTVIAANAVGDSVPSVASAPVTPSVPTPFTDDFNRSDRPLAGDNGWVASTGTGLGGVSAAYAIASNQVVNNDASGTHFDPLLHVRNDGTPGVADVTVTHSFGPGSFQFARLYVASDLANLNSIALEFDGSSFAYNIARHSGFDSDDTGVHTVYSTAGIATYNGGWSGWSVGTPMTIRVVYTEATGLVEVYQGGVKKLDCSMAAANFGTDGALAALSAMPYCGIKCGSGDSDRFDDLVCA